MFTTKSLESLKTGAGYFISSAGGVLFVVGMVSFFVSVSSLISIPIAVTVGIGCGGYGVYTKYKKLTDAEIREAAQREVMREEKQERARIEDIEREQSQLLSATKDLSKLARSLEYKMTEIVVLEQKRDEKSKPIQASPESVSLRIHVTEQDQIEERVTTGDSFKFFSPVLNKTPVGTTAPTSANMPESPSMTLR